MLTAARRPREEYKFEHEPKPTPTEQVLGREAREKTMHFIINKQIRIVLVNNIWTTNC